MNRYALDIETAPLETAADMFDPADVKVGNLKDPAKIEAKIEEAREEFTAKAALHWMTGRITCICMYGETQSHTFVGAEEEILEKFWCEWKRADQIITWNGYAFDTQFICMRSLVYGMIIDPIMARGTKYFRSMTDRHIDLMSLYESCGQYVSLNKVAQAILGEQKTGTGKDAIGLFQEGRIRELAEYCMNDARLTWLLWLRIGGC
jgi:predicted PolB exonuclease-like 3'-5' exonuclease